MKIGDAYPLSCGHVGRVIWLSEDGATMAVRGQHLRCPVCVKGSGDSRTVNVYLLPTP
jgi:hypothetical protein